jgi:hypothetical protein
MKKYMLLLLQLFFIQSLQAQTPKLFVYIVSHNEDNIGYLNLPNGYNNYMSARNALIDVCDMVQNKGLKYNYGADHVALRACAQYDTGSVVSNTNAKNLVQWMVEDRNIECDPHSHESSYNYADVAYFMSQLNVVPTNTMSGFLCYQPQNGHAWDTYQNGVSGDSFPSFTWYPEILWGAGTPGHFNDPIYYGVYKPQSMANFSVHDSTNHLIYCGTGCALKIRDTSTVAYMFAGIKAIADDIANGIVPSNGIYMQEIFFSEGNVNDPWFYGKLDALTDSVNTLVAAGKAEWKNISEIVDIWKTTYNSQPFAMDCNHNIIIQTTGLNENANQPAINIFPNPFTDFVYVQTGSPSKKTGRIFSSDGKLISDFTVSENYTLNTAHLQHGIYFLEVDERYFKLIK